MRGHRDLHRRPAVADSDRSAAAPRGAKAEAEIEIENRLIELVIVASAVVENPSRAKYWQTCTFTSALRRASSTQAVGGVDQNETTLTKRLTLHRATCF